MFEIRAICEPADASRVATMLGTAFTTGPVRRYPTREGEWVRLYVTADHRPPRPRGRHRNRPTPPPPSITSEIGWTARTVAHTPRAATP
ncbi:hypothetical protein [Streptomyces sp. NPDC052107]|uniref:hypothetical protein n=1 Tax=Streptomyces sp. NPDC052107 TaxID=3155632 RepID=UPI00343010BB